MNVDARLDPEGEKLPAERFINLRTTQLRRSTHLKERVELRAEESAQLNQDLAPDPVSSPADDDMRVITAGADGKSLQVIMENDVGLPELFRKAYHTDAVCGKILAHPEAHPHFRVVDGLIWTKNQLGRDVVCIPREVFLRGRRIIEMIIGHAHKVIGHFS